MRQSKLVACVCRMFYLFNMLNKEVKRELEAVFVALELETSTTFDTAHL